MTLLNCPRHPLAKRLGVGRILPLRSKLQVGVDGLLEANPLKFKELST